jgi:hypothetical protein
MNYECLNCDVIISGSRFCPLCGGESSTPSTSTISIEEYNPLKRKESPTYGDYGEGERVTTLRRPLVPRKRRKIVPSTSYALVHTLGLNSLDPMGGDGAYSNWLHGHFTSNLHESGCVHVERFLYEGKKQGKDEKLIPLLNDAFILKFKQLLQKPQLRMTSTIILNWHLRRTGRPNAWTGRGLNKSLFKALRSMAADHGFRLLLVYTIHETEGLDDPSSWCFRPDSMIALNPDVHRYLSNQFIDREVGISQVPGLLTSLHTTSLDRILGFLGDETPEESRSLAGAFLMQQLRIANTYGTVSSLRKTIGVVVFGMITGRHGTTEENLRRLCHMLSRAGFQADFKVVVVGKTQDRTLAGNLKALSKENVHLTFHGELDMKDSFNSLVGCKYAISFDPKGYRNNASAMVNVTRAGHLLFSRNPLESDEDLVRRAVFQILLCERNNGRYIALLSHQQPRYRDTEPLRVGLRLDNYLRELSRKDL